MCAIRRALAELRLPSTPHPHFSALLDHGASPRLPAPLLPNPFSDDTAYDGLFSADVLLNVSVCPSASPSPGMHPQAACLNAGGESCYAVCPV